MSLALSAGLLAASMGAAAASPDPASAEDLVRRLERRNGEVADLTARFTQTYRSGAMGRTLVETGTVSLKRPGRMRWEYESPEKKTFVADGTRFYFYVPADRQVIVSEQDTERSLAARLLSGKGGLLEEFDVSLDEPVDEGVLRVKLVPRREQPDVERAFLDVEPSGRIRSILLDDVQGNRTRFRFEGLRENTGLADRLFRFEVPAGVEVVRG